LVAGIGFEPAKVGNLAQLILGIKGGFLRLSLYEKQDTEDYEKYTN
jgi:hypothetical protein